MRSPIVISNTFFQYIVIDIMQNKLYYNGSKGTALAVPLFKN
nr:MAG TPA: hypothetical protein [Caudoviricetes sp.]DAX96522.1 MAG TPA: hypothetical protein [Caudoviricetes sp.]DAZ73047.1 MAG TPA: hypothetical protein [Caudoviricetes sp.]